MILDPVVPTPIVIENNGPKLILDNVIRSKKRAPIVRNVPPAERADLICIGNTWTAAAPIQIRGRLTDLDNKVVKAGRITEAKPHPVPFLPHFNRPIIEVPAGANAAIIQQTIDRAAGMKGRRPVVHLPRGEYNIAKTIVIPAGADLQFVGDGPENATQLRNTGGADPLIRVLGPSHVTFRNFIANAGIGAVCIPVENCDQPGARIFAEQLNASGYEYGFASEGLKNARVELHDQGHKGIQVIGAGPGTKSWVALFCVASSRDSSGEAGIHLYDVERDGRLLVRDIWYEGQAYNMMALTGRGEFAFHSAFMAPYEPDHGTRLSWETDVRQATAPLQVDGFRGKISLTLLSVSGGDLRVKPPSPDLKLYLLGFLSNRDIDLGGASVRGRVVADHTRFVRSDQTGSDAKESLWRPSPGFIREMLRPPREVRPQPLTALKNGVTDVRFYRVWANGKNGVRLQSAPGQSER